MQHKIYCDSEPDAKRLRNALDKCRGVTCDRVGEHVYTNANRFMSTLFARCFSPWDSSLAF